VAGFRLSNQAEADLMAIGIYTLQTWSEKQAIRYIDNLENCCQRLAENPKLGRPCDYVRPGLRRLEHGRHVIFYRIETGGILVSRILHRRMLPKKHVTESR
jgi:toxin ParE1/3/4